ncbi:GNAT family N-acetyltransferase [Butyrivibrio sp. INlla16]|uniref:GNAT family N-acetyltransferase n=1 Tax=Butyrivibrio sp. INlla16 TaxID=1520807 RepID=UPI00088A2E41|nr:GNAT family N-acetyltransferase [Butyrivibrio sp. INlla16]SDB68867.1 Acetyltransferase (GNAT) domain-containing protein [Butyrivibrio sp. INlla16]
MLRKIMKYSDLDERKLMDIYTESNFENTEYFYPDETDKNKAVKLVEAGFCNYLKNDFYNLDDSIYWIYEEDGKWLCALRTNMIKPGLFYLEALETPPESRRKGYACRLINDVLEDMKNDGSFKLCVCISKKNIASLKTHEKCGFKIVSEKGYDYLSNEENDSTYGLEYNYMAD